MLLFTFVCQVWADTLAVERVYLCKEGIDLSSKASLTKTLSSPDVVIH